MLVGTNPAISLGGCFCDLLLAQRMWINELLLSVRSAQTNSQYCITVSFQCRHENTSPSMGIHLFIPLVFDTISGRLV
jgi:hypothetical protein